MTDVKFSDILNSTFRSFARNKSYAIPGVYDIDRVDASWIFTSALIFLGLQTGLGLFEAGITSRKNKTNVMMKKIADVSCVGLAYWMYGFAFMYGRGSYTNPFFGFGDFFVNVDKNDELMKQVFTFLFFQICFCSTATTIASGGAAERFKYTAYLPYCFLNCIVFSVGSGWIWGEHGFLKNLGAIDFAGSGPIHIIGGAGAFVSACFIGPRIGRYDKGTKPLPLGDPFSICVGFFILWWSWLSFNAGSSYGLLNGKWDAASRAGLNTFLSSMAAGVFSLWYSMVRNKGRVCVFEVISGILSALVAINAGCFIYQTHSAVIVGIISALLCFMIVPVIDNLKIDDAVGATAVHLVGGIWGQVAVGLFADQTSGYQGLFLGGGFYLLSVQIFSSISLTLWSASMTLLILWGLNKIIPIRLSAEKEIKGCDLTEHVDEVEEVSQTLPTITNIESITPIENRFICPCKQQTENIFGKRRSYQVNHAYEK